jgi:hypothetical protein
VPSNGLADVTSFTPDTFDLAPHRHRFSLPNEQSVIPPGKFAEQPLENSRPCY